MPQGNATFILTELVGLNSSTSPRSLALTGEPRVIGRSEKADLRLPFPSVSRRHAAIWAEGDVVYLKDLGSQSGTFVNSTPVAGQVALRQGDLIAIGTTIVFLLNREEAVGKEETPEPEQGMVDSPLVELALSAVSPEKARRYLEAIYAVTAKAVAHQNESQLLAGVLDDLESVISAERFFAMVGDDAAALTIVARKLRSPDKTKQWSLPSKEILRRALASEKPIISFDAQSDERFRRRTSIAMSDVHSTICVSLRAGERPIGLLYADNHVGAGLFSIEDGTFVETMSRIVSLGLLRSRNERRRRPTRETPSAPPPRAEARSALADSAIAELEAHLRRLDQLCQAREENEPLRQLRGERRRLKTVLEGLLGQQAESTTPGVGDPR
jgi:pSer/pThr/pTyr-binding forkhead associated (FHA) protein